ncbi:MAG: tRNA threonylcarbamoyladenosine biosynthesis protein TsaE [Cognaticolwellia sp.]|jgi:tRNA threonylcarbamoyladenosine biosynthesis protein TsaE
MKTYLNDAQATKDLGRQIAELAYPGLVLALQGELGAGKTTLAQGVGDGLNVQDRVRSPTFIILSLYDQGRLPMVHADLYRLGDESELVELGLEEHISLGVTLIEWSELFPELLPNDHLVVLLADQDEGRIASIIGTGAKSQDLVESLRLLRG